MRRIPIGASFEAVLHHGPTSATMGVRVIDNQGGTPVVRFTTGVVEYPAGSGVYQATIPAITQAGRYQIVWDDGTVAPGHVAGEDVYVSNDAALAGDEAYPNQIVETTTRAPTSGLVGTIGLRIIDNQGATVRTRQTENVIEHPAGSGLYQATINAPSVVGEYSILWDTGGALSPSTTATEPLTVRPLPADVPLVDDWRGARIPAWLEFCGVEVANPARVLDYMRQLAAGAFAIEADSLPLAFYTARGEVERFVSPDVDPAPWFDPNRPESADFLGVLLQPLDGLGGTASRSPVTRGGRFGGATIGALATSERVLDCNGYLIARAACGLEYGLRWLTDVLSRGGECAECDTRVRVCAPPSDGSDDQMGLWRLYDVGLLNGPTPDATPENCATYLPVKFQLVAGTPYLYKDPEVCLAPTILNPEEAISAACVPFDDWLCGPPLSGPVCCTVSPPVIGQEAAIITIDAAGFGVSGVTISIYDSCPPADGQTPLSQLSIPYLAAGARIVIDSAREVIDYVAPDGTLTDGTPYIELPPERSVSWLRINPSDAAACICAQAAHPCSGGQDAFITVETQHLER